MAQNNNFDYNPLLALSAEAEYEKFIDNYNSSLEDLYIGWDDEMRLALKRLYNEFTVGYNKIIKRQKKDKLRMLNKVIPNDIVSIVGEYFQPQQFKQKIDTNDDIIEDYIEGSIVPNM